MTVFDLKKGQAARVLSVRCGGGAAERLCALGLSAGAKVVLLGFSLFKSAALIAVGANRVGVRREIAKSIEVKPWI